MHFIFLNKILLCNFPVSRTGNAQGGYYTLTRGDTSQGDCPLPPLPHGMLCISVPPYLLTVSLLLTSWKKTNGQFRSHNMTQTFCQFTTAQSSAPRLVAEAKRGFLMLLQNMVKLGIDNKQRYIFQHDIVFISSKWYTVIKRII